MGADRSTSRNGLAAGYFLPGQVERLLVGGGDDQVALLLADLHLDRRRLAVARALQRAAEHRALAALYLLRAVERQPVRLERAVVVLDSLAHVGAAAAGGEHDRQSADRERCASPNQSHARGTIRRPRRNRAAAR